MKRWISFVASFYPRSWREEFGDEFEAVLDDVRPGWRVLRNVLWGAMEMRLFSETDWTKSAAAMAVVGAVVALGVSFTKAPRYESSAVVTVTPQADPVRNTSPEVLHERALARIGAMKAAITSRWVLRGIINDPSLKLYPEELRNTSPDDVMEKMHDDIRIEALPSENGDPAPIRLAISFSYPDQGKAQAVVKRLVNKFVEMNAEWSHTFAMAYNGYWQEMEIADHAPPAPPLPPGDIVGTEPAPNLPERGIGPMRMLYIVAGLSGGFLFAVTVLALRRSSGVQKLVLFALAGGVLAGAGSFLIPVRYTSHADMIIEPAYMTEDPMASPPGPSAIEFLRQTEPTLLSDERLTRIIRDPRLHLYADELAKKPIGEILKRMRDQDLRISTLRPALGAASAFRVSFTYPDRFKAQQTATAVMNAFDELNMTRQKAAASHASVRQRALIQRRLGEGLDVLAVPNLPQTPESPRRIPIALGGLGAGLVVGGIFLWSRRGRKPGSLLAVEGVGSYGSL